MQNNSNSNSNSQRKEVCALEKPYNMSESNHKIFYLDLKCMRKMRCHFECRTQLGSAHRQGFHFAIRLTFIQFSISEVAICFPPLLPVCLLQLYILLRYVCWALLAQKLCYQQMVSHAPQIQWLLS